MRRTAGVPREPESSMEQPKGCSRVAFTRGLWSHPMLDDNNPGEAAV